MHEYEDPSSLPIAAAAAATAAARQMQLQHAAAVAAVIHQQQQQQLQMLHQRVADQFPAALHSAAGAPVVGGPPAAAAGDTAASAAAAPYEPKRRKEYVIQKHREAWTDAEHAAFESALRSEGRNWKRIAQLIPSKSVIQIRSHAQKHFLKLDRAGQHADIPPARPKKRAAHPYPKVRAVSKTSSYSWNKSNEEQMRNAQQQQQQQQHQQMQAQLNADDTSNGANLANMAMVQAHLQAQAMMPMMPLAQAPPLLESMMPGMPLAASMMALAPRPLPSPPPAPLPILHAHAASSAAASAISPPRAQGSEPVHSPLTNQISADPHLTTFNQMKPAAHLHAHAHAHSVPFAASEPVDSAELVADTSAVPTPVSLLAVLSSVSSLLPPASPLDKSRARQRAAAAARKSGKSLAPPRAPLPMVSPLPPTPSAPSHASLTHTPASTFYKPYTQTPFLSPSTVRPVTDTSSSPTELLFPSATFASSSKKLYLHAPVNTLAERRRLNFDEADDSPEVVANGTSFSKARVEVRAGDMDHLSDPPHLDWANLSIPTENDSPSSLGVGASKRSSTTGTTASGSSSHVASVERDRKRRSSGHAHSTTPIQLQVDERDGDQKRARRSIAVTPHHSADSPFTWLTDSDDVQSKCASDVHTQSTSVTYPLYDAHRATNSTPLTGDTDGHPTETSADWSATSSSSFSIVSSQHSPALESAARIDHRARAAAAAAADPHSLHTRTHFDELPPTDFLPLPFVNEAQVHVASKLDPSSSDVATPLKPRTAAASFFSPMTPGPIGLHAMLASPFGHAANSAQNLFSPTPAGMHAFATPRDFYVHTPDKQQRGGAQPQDNGHFSPVPQPCFQHSPSA